MSSGSTSDCCVDPCACQAWLEVYCNAYVTFTHTYCGESYQYESGRKLAIPKDAVNPQSMIHADDAIFEFSDYENAMESGVGATITDEDGTEWTVYRVRKIDDLCIWRVWARSVAYCFQLLDKVEVLEREKCDAAENCDPVFKMEKVVGKCRGKILVNGGAASTANRAEQMKVTYTGSLTRWPAGDHPLADHFLRTKQGLFRITRFTDSGPFVPYQVTLEKVDADGTSC